MRYHLLLKLALCCVTLHVNAAQWQSVSELYLNMFNSTDIKYLKVLSAAASDQVDYLKKEPVEQLLCFRNYDNCGTLLHMAAAGNATNVFGFLVDERGLSLNTTTYGGASPVEIAVLFESLNVLDSCVAKYIKELNPVILSNVVILALKSENDEVKKRAHLMDSNLVNRLSNKPVKHENKFRELNDLFLGETGAVEFLQKEFTALIVAGSLGVVFDDIQYPSLSPNEFWLTKTETDKLVEHLQSNNIKNVLFEFETPKDMRWILYIEKVFKETPLFEDVRVSFNSKTTK